MYFTYAYVYVWANKRATGAGGKAISAMALLYVQPERGGEKQRERGRLEFHSDNQQGPKRKSNSPNTKALYFLIDGVSLPRTDR